MTFRIVIGCMLRVVTADRHHHRQSWIEKAIELQVSKGVSRNTSRTMTAIPSSALLGQFACDITPAGQAVFGLKAQPFTDNHGAVLGEVFDAERGNVSLALARKASLVAECHRLGLNAAGTAATLRAVLQRSMPCGNVTGR